MFYYNVYFWMDKFHSKISILLICCLVITYSIDTEQNASACFVNLNVNASDLSGYQMSENCRKFEPNFILFTRTGPKEGSMIPYANQSIISNSEFDGTKQTKVIVHGFDSSPSSGNFYKLKDAILTNYDVNIILVDWSKSCQLEDLYENAVRNTPTIGAMVAIQVRLLCMLKKSHPSWFHFMGHSLGSHISAYSGKFLKVEGKAMLGRITGLDPAGKFFENEPPNKRLDRNDALFVDVIHTNGLPLLPDGGLGMLQPCGHVDFYPNGGIVQPGCIRQQFPIFSKHQKIKVRAKAKAESWTKQVLFEAISCDHRRAVDYLIEAYLRNDEVLYAYSCFNFDEFKEGKCSDCGINGNRCAILGERAVEYQKFLVPSDLESAKIGDEFNGNQFFFITDGKEPFLKEFQYLVHINLGEGPWFSKLNVTITLVDGKDDKESILPINERDSWDFEWTKGENAITVDPEGLKEIKFTWENSGLSSLFDWMYDLDVDSIDVFILSKIKKKKPIKFCPTMKGVSAKKVALFDFSENPLCKSVSKE